MNWLKTYLTSSIGRKQLMGVTGIGLYLFLIVHLLGNFGLFSGPEHFNKYAHLLLHNLAEIIVPIEFGLLAIFLVHIWTSVTVTMDNRAARGSQYHAKGKARTKTLFSTTMAVSGVWLFLFLLIHVPHLRFGAMVPEPMVTYDGVEMKNLYKITMDGFSHAWYTGFYVVSMVLVAFHLAHGVQSSLQTIGFNHPKYRGMVRWISSAYALIIGAGFIVIAVWAFFQQGGAA